MGDKVYREREWWVKLDTFWQGSADRWVGPFTTRPSANTAIEQAMNAEGSLVVRVGQNPADLKHAIRVWGVRTRSEARREGMREGENTNVIGSTIPLNTDELFEMQQPTE